MKYLHDPVSPGNSVGPQSFISHAIIFVIGFAATEAICAAVILEKIPCYDCYDACDYDTCYGALCYPGPVD